MPDQFWFPLLITALANANLSLVDQTSTGPLFSLSPEMPPDHINLNKFSFS